MVSLPEYAVTTVQRKRKRDKDKEKGVEVKMAMFMTGLKLIVEVKTNIAMIFHVSSKLTVLPPTTESHLALFG